MDQAFVDSIQKMGAAGALVFGIMFFVAWRKLDAKDKQIYDLTIAGIKAMNDTTTVLSALSAKLNRSRRRR